MEPEKAQWALSAPPREAHTTQCEPITKIASLHSLIRTPCSPSHSRHAPPPGTAPASPVLLCSAHCPHLDPTRPDPAVPFPGARRRDARGGAELVGGAPRPATRSLGLAAAHPRRQVRPLTATTTPRRAVTRVSAACSASAHRIGVAWFFTGRAVIRTGEISNFRCRVRSTCNCCWVGWVRLGRWLNPKDAT
jgi:hypothetical protein